MLTKIISTLPPTLTIILLLPWSISVATITDYELLETTDVVEDSKTYEGSSILTILMTDVAI